MTTVEDLINVEEKDQYLREIVRKYPQLFRGIGNHKNFEYKIELKANAITTPRRVPALLMKEVQAQINAMLEHGVIAKVEKPTKWCSQL